MIRGKRVQDFFPKYSLGLMGYKMERTHSIMRIATTASPVSGDAVREQMQLLKTRARFINAANLIRDRWNVKQKERLRMLRKEYSMRAMDMSGNLQSSLRSLNASYSTMSPMGSERAKVVTAASAALDALMIEGETENDKKED